MTIMPTKFILRSPQYPQNEEYGQYCTDSSNELLEILKHHKQENKPIDADEINGFLGKKLENFFGQEDKERQNFALTPLNEAGIKYMHYAREALLTHPETLGGIHNLNDGKVRMTLDDREPPIELTEIWRNAPSKTDDVLTRHIEHMKYPKTIGKVTLYHRIAPDEPRPFA